MDKNIVGAREVLNVCLCFDCGGVGGVGGECVGSLELGMDEWSGVMSVQVVSLDFVCRCQVQVSVYCARRIPAHLRCISVQSCCTLSISPSYHLFVYGRYRKSRLVYA